MLRSYVVSVPADDASPFLPLLAQLGDVTVVHHPCSQLDFAIRQTQPPSPVVLSLMPFEDIYMTPHAPNVIWANWTSFDEVGRSARQLTRLRGDRIARRAAALLVGSTQAARAFQERGIPTPIHVVPAAVDPSFFALAGWDPREPSALEVYGWTRGPRVEECDPWEPPRREKRLVAWGRKTWKLGQLLAETVGIRQHLAFCLRRLIGRVPSNPPAAAEAFPLNGRGALYTAALPTLEPAPWQSLLSAFHDALGATDATLLLLVGRDEAACSQYRNACAEFLSGLGDSPCRVVFLPYALPRALRLQVVKASTYFVCASGGDSCGDRALEFLAAGRPYLGPVHTAYADFAGEELGFIVPSQPVPMPTGTGSPRPALLLAHDPDWAALRAAFRSSFELLQRPQDYQRLSRAARERAHAWAGQEHVLSRLQAALGAVAAASGLVAHD